jgi:hypothetical protein
VVGGVLGWFVGGHQNQNLPVDGHEAGIVAITERQRFPVSPAVGLLPITGAS